MTNYLKDIIINDALVNSGFRHVRLLHDHAPSHTSDACEVLEDYRLAASTILFRSSPMRHFLSPKQKFFSGASYKSRQTSTPEISQSQRTVTYVRIDTSSKLFQRVEYTLKKSDVHFTF